MLRDDAMRASPSPFIPTCERKNHPMKLHTYLNYGGNCREAFSFYEKHLGGKIMMMMTHGEAPMPAGVGPEWKDKILHAHMQLGETDLMASDVPKSEPMRSVYLSLMVDSSEEAERIYTLLTDGGEVYMPMQETFFAFRFGQLRDKFGTSWMVLHPRPMPQP
jgi:PhnB protein